MPSLVEDGALNVVVVGGGPTGIETAGALAELYRGSFVKDYPAAPPREGADHPRRGRSRAPDDVQEGHPHVHEEGAREVRRRGDARRAGRLGRADPRQPQVRHGARRSHARLGRGPPGEPDRVLARASSSRRAIACRSRPDLSVAGHPEVFAVGDVAWITDTKTKQVLPAARLGRAPGRASARVRTSPVSSRARRRSRSPTTTRGRWPRSAGGQRSSSSAAAAR